MKSLQELTDLVDALRSRGVYHFRQGDLEIHLSAAPEAAPEDKPAEKDTGWRGYTQEERDLLGVGD